MVIDYKRLQRLKVPDEPWFDMNHVCYVVMFIGFIVLYIRAYRKMDSTQKQSHTQYTLWL